MSLSNESWRPAVLGLLCALGLLGTAPARAEAPRVVVSIAPIHSLVAGVMEGVGTPTLLIQGAGSPHSYTLRPSEAQALQQADVVFWVGEELETFLVRPLAALPGGAHAVALIDAPGMRLLPVREGGAWESHAHGAESDADHDHADHHHGDAHDHGHDHAHDHAGTAEAHDHDHGHAAAAAEGHGAEDHDHGAHDAHLWLDPENAGAIVRAAAASLSARDPANAGAYAANATQIEARLDGLEAELTAALAPVRTVPYVVFHDAYQYFEDRFGLNAVGTITVSPERAPGAQRLQEIRQKIRELGARCVFSEPQFEPRLVETVTEGLAVRRGVLDPLGADLPNGPDHYFALLSGLANSLGECLGEG